MVDNKLTDGIDFVDFPLNGAIKYDIYLLDGEYFEVMETEYSGREWIVSRMRDHQHTRLNRSYLDTRVQLVPPSQRQIVKQLIRLWK